MKRPVLVALCMATFILATSTGGAKGQERVSSINTVDSGDKFIVHEWGTFTTFSGSDGVFLDFRPLAAQHKDLPNYVLDRGSYSQGFAKLLTKSRLWGRVRMETPVTYFYSDRVRTVDVQVRFPQGLLTEFYPPVTTFQPPIQEEQIFSEGELIGQSSLTWKQVNIVPLSALAPNVADAALRQQLVESISHSLVPHANDEEHYAAARQTDSALVHIRDRSQSYFEKFLFYRGVGKFDLPIRANFVGQEISVENRGPNALRSIIAINVQDDSVQVAKLDQLDSNQMQTIDKLVTMTAEQLANLVRESLEAEGLYEKEARSMVATWQNSWFTENGTRVLYMVPTPVTETLLPLNVNPQPQETVRVLVGRLELMSPEAEQAMIQSVATSAQQRTKYYARASQKAPVAPYAVPKDILSFGRMAEPALIRISKIAKDQTIRQEAEALIAQFQQQ